ncbi:MAG TPA: HEAT repeat domain-containing protein, partial [Candidatus Eisenbacteria bacterium]|nr:HEAT repeat domain-containing protein [Candidatus Eisenbacteria bacterium]
EAPADPAVKPVAAWINQFARTLKTCRLYHANNPTVVKFREELADALTRLIDAHGPITCRFSADDILYGDASLYPARSRDDNLALPFHRDGVRGLTFQPGVTRRELDALIDALMLVTGQIQADDDLVTLLWQANLKSIEVDYVPAEGDVGASVTEESGALMPWPTAAAQAPEPAEASGTDAATVGGPDGGSRSDDWTTGDFVVEIEAGFAELDAMAPTEIERFRGEFSAEHEVPLMTTALAIAHAFLDAGIDPEDREELARFVPRMLRLALGEGSWLEAREALSLLRECGSEGSVESLTQELFQPISIAATVEQLDRQDARQVAEFVALAEAMGEPGAEWLNLVLAESQHRITRKVISEALTRICREQPERIAPWLADSRWYVVRNAVQILGWIGGDPISGMLRGVLHHADPRVRHEVVTALGTVEPAIARPMLIELLSGADSRLFCAILAKLGSGRDGSTARMLVGYLQSTTFEQRPDEEKRAIYNALSATGTDDVLPELELELVKGNWMTRGLETHRAAIARCIARIGTPRARALLERGAESKRATVRAACADVLKRLHD